MAKLAIDLDSNAAVILHLSEEDQELFRSVVEEQQKNKKRKSPISLATRVDWSVQKEVIYANIYGIDFKVEQK